MRAIFLATRIDGQEVIGEAIFEKGKVEFRGMPSKLKRSLEEDGIVDKKTGRQYFPSDGKRFIEELPSVFDGSYLNVELVE